jgi:hypothetical protein
MSDTRNELPPAGITRHGARTIDRSWQLIHADISECFTGIACAGDKWLGLLETQPHAKP